MRKLILLLAIVASTTAITSCSNDDNDNNEPKQDKLIGKWQITSMKLNEKPVVDNCLEKEIITVKADGTLTQEEYEEDGMNNCIADGTENGTWENKGNNIYNIAVGDLVLDYTVTFSGDTLVAIASEGGDTVEFNMKRVQ